MATSTSTTSIAPPPAKNQESIDSKIRLEDFETAFEWACAYTNLQSDAKSAIRREILAIFDSGDDIRKARKTVTPLLPSNLVWHDLGQYLMPIPTIAELVEDEELSRQKAKLEQQRLKELAQSGMVLEFNKPAQVAETLAHFVVMKAYMLGHWRNFRKFASFRPYLTLDAIDDALTPKDCLRKDGKVHSVEDPYWEQNPVPCGRAFCRCTLRSLTKEEAGRRIKKS